MFGRAVWIQKFERKSFGHIFISPLSLVCRKSTLSSMTTTQRLFTFRILETRDIKPAAVLVGQSFCANELISKHLNLRSEDFSHWVEQILNSHASEGYSLVAEDSETNTIVGAVIAKEMGDAGEAWPPYEQSMPIFVMLDKLWDFMPGDILERRGKILHMLLAATCTKSEKQGICRELMTRCIESARDRGLEVVVAEATSAGSQHILANKLKFESHGVIVYDEYGEEFCGCPGEAVLMSKRFI